MVLRVGLESQPGHLAWSQAWDPAARARSVACTRFAQRLLIPRPAPVMHLRTRAWRDKPTSDNIAACGTFGEPNARLGGRGFQRYAHGPTRLCQLRWLANYGCLAVSEQTC